MAAQVASASAASAASSWTPTALLSRYNAALAAAPMKTNMITGFVIAAAGDLICQLGFESDKPYRLRRTLEMGAIRCFFMGPFLTVYFPFLARSAPGTSTPQVLKRLALDQVIGSPVSIAGTFAFASLLQGKPETLVPRLQEQLVPTMLAGMTFWPFLHFFNFKMTPLQHQALVAHAASLGWNAYLSFKANQTLHTPAAASSVTASTAAAHADAAGDVIASAAALHASAASASTSAAVVPLASSGSAGLPDAALR